MAEANDRELTPVWGFLLLLVLLIACIGLALLETRGSLAIARKELASLRSEITAMDGQHQMDILFLRGDAFEQPTPAARAPTEIDVLKDRLSKIERQCERAELTFEKWLKDSLSVIDTRFTIVQQDVGRLRRDVRWLELYSHQHR